MTQARPKRLLLGALALLAPLPLPFSEVIGWKFTFAYWAAVALFLFRAWRNEERWLPTWAMNVLALAYVPFFYFDLTAFWRGRLLQPVVHLVMFALAVKLLSLRTDRDKWQVLLTTFFIFLAAMGSSVHPSVMLYLGAFLLLAFSILIRFAGWEAAAGVPVARIRDLAVPVRGYVTLALLATTLAAIPLFAFLPRLRQPYVLGANPGGGLGRSTVTANSFGLDSIGRVRTSRAVALRLAYEQAPPAGDLRLRTTVYDRFVGDGWQRGEVQGRPTPFRRSRDGFFRLADDRSRAWAQIWLRRSGAPRLALPVETVAIDVPARFLSQTPAGEIAVLAPGEGTLGYRVGLAPGEPGIAALPSPAEGAAELALDHVSDDVARLAERVAGQGSARERADRLESHLLRNYEYTLDLGSEPTDRPVERFLLETRRGHCEYFASGLVLLLRSQGIPARLATGYLGAEYNPLEEYFIVRHTNAHAWVEAYLPDEGWRTFEPTPPSGRPGASTSGLLLKLGQAYDYMLFRWDRYVLTYGFGDQIGILLYARDLWGGLWDRFRGRQRTGGPDTTAAIEPEEEAPATEEESAEPVVGPQGLRWVSLAVLVCALAWAMRHRRSFSATRAYRALRDRADGRGLGLTESTPPLELQRRIALRYPGAAPAAERVIELYLRESFSGASLAEAELAEARTALLAAGRGLRKTA